MSYFLLILEGYEQQERVLQWIIKGVNVVNFMRPFKGMSRGVHYDCDIPPARVMGNHNSCNKFSDLISHTLEERLLTGVVGVWGKVGEVAPPRLVLPMTVEPSKQRLCVDARFLNLWMRDSPFSLDKLRDVPRYVYPD